MNPISTSESQTATLLQNDEEHNLHSITPGPQLRVSRKTIVNIYICFFLFCLIEAGFIMLASVCLVRLLSLMFGLSNLKIKSGLTIIFIV